MLSMSLQGRILEMLIKEYIYFFFCICASVFLFLLTLPKSRCHSAPERGASFTSHRTTKKAAALSSQDIALWIKVFSLPRLSVVFMRLGRWTSDVSDCLSCPCRVSAWSLEAMFVYAVTGWRFESHPCTYKGNHFFILTLLKPTEKEELPSQCVRTEEIIKQRPGEQVPMNGDSVSEGIPGKLYKQNMLNKCRKT